MAGAGAIKETNQGQDQDQEEKDQDIAARDPAVKAEGDPAKAEVERRLSRSRTKSPGWKDRSDYKETQAKLHQSDITDLREETRRLQTEREAVFREKERLLTGPASTGGPASKARVETQASGAQ